MTDSQYDDIRERIRSFRFFPIKGRKEMGDRFLQPWLICHVYASGNKGRGEMKRALKEIRRFFAQKELQNIRKDAGLDGDRIIEETILDSANVYLTICRDDDGFGKKLFGLMRMKADEKENKIIRDVYNGIIPLLARIDDFAERFAMMRAIDLACRSLYPQRLGDMKAWIDSIEDADLHAVFHAFEIPEEASES
ncbi:MAG TPA: hypothetical protein GX734_00310 [Clostridiaceae bacterium]|jgi:hypothetical protein|nr:hypothetical protein [Clostridiaceae bacterium]